MVYVVPSLSFGLCFTFLLFLEETQIILKQKYYTSTFILGTPGFTQSWLDVPVGLPLYLHCSHPLRYVSTILAHISYQRFQLLQNFLICKNATVKNTTDREHNFQYFRKIFLPTLF